MGFTEMSQCDLQFSVRNIVKSERTTDWANRDFIQSKSACKLTKRNNKKK